MSAFAASPFVIDAPLSASPEGRLLRALRIWVLIACRRHNPRASVRPLLGPAEPAFALFMDEVVTLWPEPLLTFPPCATCLAPDESLLLGVLRAAAAHDRALADRLACEFLGTAERERLWRGAARVVEAMDSSVPPAAGA
ncbi:MAG: hypothetical protein SNJ63_01770 [Sphingomonadaceae bacterium]